MYGLSLDLEDGSPSVLHVRGDVDMANADEFAAVLKEAMSTDSKMVVDMADVTFIDAAGLQAILRVAGLRNGAGPLTLINAPRVAWLLDLVGLEKTPSLDVRDGK
jgi:anti-anti-sigma factor